MTNSEKYLKDGVVAKELWKMFQVYYYKNKNKESDVEKAFRSFFEEQAQPTLTEDERVILRNIQSPFKWIRRTSSGELQISDTEGLERTQWIIQLSCFPHLFQFIKERRRI